MFQMIHASYQCLRHPCQWRPTSQDEAVAKLEVEAHLAGHGVTPSSPPQAFWQYQLQPVGTLVQRSRCECHDCTQRRG